MRVFGNLFSLFCVLVPTITYAQDAADSAPPEGLDAVAALIEAAKGGKWSLFVSLLIMFLVWLATKTPLLKNVIKGEAKIWTAAIAGVLASFATTVYTGHLNGSVDWVRAVVDGLAVGLAAGGLWSLIGRKIAGKTIDADGDGKLDELESE